MFYLVLLSVLAYLVCANSDIVAFRTDYDNVSDASYNSTSYTDEYSICDGVGYNFGKWVPRDFKQDPAQNFACCGEGVGNAMICNDKTIPSNEEHGCNCERRFYNDNNISSSSAATNRTTAAAGKSHFNPQSVNYDWVPSNCELASWNAYEFCKLLGKKKILLIGDSTMRQSYSVITNMIAQTNISDPYLRTCISQIKQIFSDFPLGLPLPPDARGRGSSVLTTVAQEWKDGRSYDIIIFSLGFHIHKLIKPGDSKLNVSDQSYGEYFAPRMMEEVDNIRSIYKFSGLEYPIVMYKTDNMPHSNCQAQYDRGPQPDLDSREHVMSLNKDSKYMWNKEFNLEDHIIHACNERKVPILRMHPLYSRSDGHPPEECLHYCTPGPLNIIGRLLLHFLKVSVEYWMQSDSGVVVASNNNKYAGKKGKPRKQRPPSSSSSSSSSSGT